MIPELWPTVDAIVADALELAPAERDAFVERACEDRPEIAAEVHSLLDLSDAAADFLDCHTLGCEAQLDQPHTPPVPDRIGPYRIIEEAGHGGMSVVYRAERDDGQFCKTVAIKLLVTGWVSPAAMRRFVAERQILATLDHPNICRLLDGGVTAGGAPYLVMEFVDGVHLLQYCRQMQLGERERLRLFQRICQAVQFAHQNLIVHRDIKPGNVLVTRTGELKLMDFGIAKILAGSGEGDRTQTGFATMTPDYASPEHIKGQPITTQSDIYSLGVLLYQLLTGRLPYQTSGKGLEQLLDIVGNSEAPPAPGLAPELLAIVRCAMCKEPRGRFSSASALGDDVGRYLSGIPVLAVSPSRWYVLRKWIRRHRNPVLAGAVAAILILGASAWAWRSAIVAQRERAVAEQRFNQVRLLARQVMFTYPNSLQKLGVATDVQARMALDSLDYLDSLAGVKTSDNGLLLELADGYMQVGFLVGPSRFHSLGNRPKALEAFRKARGIVEDVSRRTPGSRAARLRLSTVLRSQAELDDAHFTELTQQSFGLLQDLYRQDPVDRKVLRGLAETHLGIAYRDQGAEHARRAIEFGEAWLERLADPSLKPSDRAAETPVALAGLAFAHRLLGWSLLNDKEQNAALVEAQNAMAADERARSAASNEGAFPMNMSFDLHLIARANLRMNHLVLARDYFRRSAAIQRRVFEANREDAFVQNRFLEGLAWQGWTAERLGDWTEARSVYREAAGLASRFTLTHRGKDWNWLLGFVYGSQGLMLGRLGERSAGCSLLQRSADYYKVSGDPHPDLAQRAAEVERALARCAPQPPESRSSRN